MGSAPAKTVAADADAVNQRLAACEHKIEPPLGGVYNNGARRVIAGIADGAARDRARAAAASEEIGTAPQDVARIHLLGLRLAGAGQHHQRRKQTNKNPGHFLPREKSEYARD